MFKKEELVYFTLAIIVLGYVINYSAFTWLGWLQGMGLALAMIAIQVAAQNLMAYRFGAKLEYNLWDIRRYWFYEKSYFKKPFPAWLVVPILFIVITFGFVKWLAVLTFEAFPTSKRVKERWYELTEWEYALIAASGIFANLIFAIISEIVGWHEFAVLNLLFAFFNILPFSELNGMKILFGSRMLWIFSIILIVIMLILIGIASIVATVIAALALAVITLIVYYMHYEQ